MKAQGKNKKGGNRENLKKKHFLGYKRFKSIAQKESEIRCYWKRIRWKMFRIRQAKNHRIRILGNAKKLPDDSFDGGSEVETGAVR